MPSLPLGTESELQNFETFLKKSDANLSGACDYFSTYICSSVPDPERKSSHSILAHMLHNCLAKNINLEGGNGKIGFRGLQLYKVFLGTLQTAFPSSDMVVAQDALQKWLKDAKSRKQIPISVKSSLHSSGNPSRHSSGNSGRHSSGGNTSRHASGGNTSRYGSGGNTSRHSKRPDEADAA